MHPTTSARRVVHHASMLVCLIIGLCIIVGHDTSRNHYLSTDLVHLSPSSESSEQVLWSPDEVKSTRRAHGFAPRNALKDKRKVYDLVLMSTELDWPEIRLYALSRYVDYFVIIESPTNFHAQAEASPPSRELGPLRGIPPHDHLPSR
jgi:beta-1,4-mannosyl-glycoprotein beta-1,4-N-acetylglucosaminyltransferase